MYKYLLQDGLRNLKYFYIYLCGRNDLGPNRLRAKTTHLKGQNNSGPKRTRPKRRLVPGLYYTNFRIFSRGTSLAETVFGRNDLLPKFGINLLYYHWQHFGV